MNRNQVTTWAGMLGPALFVAVFTLEGWLRPGYDPLGMYVSELSLGPRGWIQIVNFLILGMLLITFAYGVAGEFREGTASHAGPILLGIVAIGLIASGLLVTDPSTIFSEQVTWHGRLHGIFEAIVFTFMPLSCFVFYRRFHKDSRWRWFQGWTLAAGFIFVASVILMKVGQVQSVSNPLHIGAGLIQRIALITYMMWIFVFALGRRKLHQ